MSIHDEQSDRDIRILQQMQQMRSICGLIKVRLTSPQPICHIWVQDKFYLKTPWGVGCVKESKYQVIVEFYCVKLPSVVQIICVNQEPKSSPASGFIP